MNWLLSAGIFFTIFSLELNSASELEDIRTISSKARAPQQSLKDLGPLVVMGNSSLETANIIFLPEVHDDPDSLMTQLLLIAHERQKGKAFIVLDESLASMRKSIWDVFSQKSLEIIAAKEQRRGKATYVPSAFESVLKVLANKFKNTPGKLTFLDGQKLWTISDFFDQATPFWGWDVGAKATLTDRNVQMVESLKKALKNHNRILVMAGARHIPELEFMTSQQLICKDERFSRIEKYFSSIEEKFGSKPKLRFGVGATVPIFNFLTKLRYVVVFDKSLYKELDQVVDQFKNQDNGRTCLSFIE